MLGELGVPRELAYLVGIAVLLILPRALQRWRIPAPLTSFALGILAALVAADVATDPVLGLLAVLGISSLFLFAGLEIEVSAFRQGRGALIQHLLLRAVALAGVAWLAARFMDIGWQPAFLLALAVLTPSTGFILDTLRQQGLNEDESFWVAAKAVAGEILALVVLFIVIQADSAANLALASLALSAMVVALPLAFVLLGRAVLPHAPGAEFSLLVLVGLVAAYVTKQLGVYYLVGAFLAGLVARLLRERMPLLASDENLRAVRLFASFFVPFYFFHAGSGIPAEALGWQALLLGLLLSACALPLRVGLQWLHRRLVFQEDAASSLRVAVTLAPTLVFTLVLAGILRERYALPDQWYGALLVYACISTATPSFVRGTRFFFNPVQ